MPLLQGSEISNLGLATQIRNFWVTPCRIWKFGSFKNPFATITSLSELYLRIRRFFSLVGTKKVISMNYDKQHKQLKTMEMNEAGLDIFYEEYLHQFQPEPTHKIH